MSCPHGKILNPISGRCVKKDGAIGKMLMGSRSSSPKRGLKDEALAELKQLKKEFDKISKEYSKYGLNDSETFSALRSVVEGKSANHQYWGLFSKYEDNSLALQGVSQLKKKAEQIHSFISRNRTPAVNEYLESTSNLRY